ncbi:MAG TPA: FtsW/RodA/SpoVE family cell cycle protein [Saprospiraceae bacterium]|nr:FtsW/RodA/SpoVE family cell cycle protein [Saprospiraceae bacterium]
MQTAANIYRNLKGDRTIWLIVLLLAMCSVLTVYSASGMLAYQNSGSTEMYLAKHFILLMIGLGIMYGASQLNYTRYSKAAPLLLLLAVPLLLYTLFLGAEVNDARRWITVPVIGLTFQTSDFARIALIVFVARSISKKQDVIKDFKTAFVPIILPVILVCALIAPANLSTAVLLFVTCLLMMFVGRVDMKYIGLMFLMGILVMGLLLFLGSFFPEFARVETWISRINDFLNNSDGGYQIQQAKIAIADGGWLGVGPGNSEQRNCLPYPYADFIYAIICEEYGLFGGLAIIALYFWLFIRCAAIVTKCPKAFGALLAMGFCLNLVIQAFANIAVSLHLVPVTGLTLPLVSMGGTSMLFTCIAFGMILSVSKYIEQATREAGTVEIKTME